MRVRLGVLVVLAGLVVTGVVGAQTYSDPVGDSGPGPDISTVALAHDKDAFTVQVRLANRTELEENEVVEIDVDLDGNASTGEEGTDLYAIYEPDDQVEVLLWQNDDYVTTTRARAEFEADGAHLRIPRPLVSGTVEVIATALGEIAPPEDTNLPPTETEDKAPDTGAYQHAVGRAALQRSTVSFSPAQPRAGRVFRVRAVSVQLTDQAAVRPTATACSATLAGRRLAPSGNCAWRLPRTAKGKVLRVSIAATLGAQRFALPARRFVVR